MFSIIDPKSFCGSTDQPIMDRLYNSLSNEMKKKNPSPSVVNAYLNQQFDSRQQQIKDMPVEERCSKLLELYPCFRNPVEVGSSYSRIHFFLTRLTGPKVNVKYHAAVCNNIASVHSERWLANSSADITQCEHGNFPSLFPNLISQSYFNVVLKCAEKNAFRCSISAHFLFPSWSSHKLWKTL